MTKTENYHLPQWEAHDPVRREDFNQAMVSIEEGIRTSYVIGTYTGNGVTLPNGGQFIELGFHPRFLFISRGWISINVNSYFLAAGEQGMDTGGEVFSLKDTGFSVGSSTHSSHLALNTSGLSYSYIAFR